MPMSLRVSSAAKRKAKKRSSDARNLAFSLSKPRARSCFRLDGALVGVYALIIKIKGSQLKTPKRNPFESTLALLRLTIPVVGSSFLRRTRNLPKPWATFRSINAATSSIFPSESWPLEWADLANRKCWRKKSWTTASLRIQPPRLLDRQRKSICKYGRMEVISNDELSIFPKVVSSSICIFVSSKFHFDETITLAGLVSSLFVVVRATFMETLRWDNFCNFGATFLGFGTLFTNIILLWIRNFEKNRTTPTPKKTQKTPKKRLMDFHDGITCQRFELEGWDLV